MRYMLDTNICIYLIKRHPEQVQTRFASHRLDDICLSSITFAELLFGVAKSSRPDQNRDALHAFTAYLTILPFDGVAAEHYAQLRAHLQRSGELIGPMDMLIAAHARSLELSLVSNNLREFKRVPDLLMENWLE